jgi:hypothetical protein
MRREVILVAFQELAEGEIVESLPAQAIDRIVGEIRGGDGESK